MNEDLLRKFDIPCPTEKLTELKNKFDNSIKSNRKLGKVGSVSDLIKVLMKRGVLTTMQLKEIALILNNMQLLKDVNDNETLLNKNSGPQGMIGNISSSNTQAQVIAPQVVTPQVVYTSNNNVRKHMQDKNRVYIVICDGMGRTQWPEFARSLCMTEGTIDTLKQYTDREAIRKILDHHENSCDPVYWRSQLLQALVDARRTDLRKNVETLMDRFEILRP